MINMSSISVASQKIRQVSACRIFLSKPQAWHIITTQSCISSALWAVSHHASACIYLRLDDIQCSALMIYNSCGIDDIHAFGVMGTREFESLLRNAQNIFFVAFIQKKTDHHSLCILSEK